MCVLIRYHFGLSICEHHLENAKIIHVSKQSAVIEWIEWHNENEFTSCAFLLSHNSHWGVPNINRFVNSITYIYIRRKAGVKWYRKWEYFHHKWWQWLRRRQWLQQVLSSISQYIRTYLNWKQHYCWYFMCVSLFRSWSAHKHSFHSISMLRWYRTHQSKQVWKKFTHIQRLKRSIVFCSSRYELSNIGLVGLLL